MIKLTLFLLSAGLTYSLFAQSNEETADGEEIDSLPAITVEANPVTRAESPLGTAFSGQILQSIPGSAGDPLRGIQSFPGVNVGSDGDVAPAIRGSRPGDNIYQADFLPIGYLFHLDGGISVFNAQLVDKFSLYSSAYGPELSGVNGGVLDVKLRDPKKDRFHATIDANILQAGLLLEGPVTQNQSFYFAGRISYLDLLVKDQLEDDDEEGITFKQFPKYSDYQGKYRWDLEENGVIKLQLAGASDTEEIDVSETAEAIENEPVLTGRHYSKQNFNSQGVVWDLPAGENRQLKSALAHYDYVNEAVAGGAGNLDVKYDISLLKSHLSSNLNEHHTLKTGFNISDVMVDFSVAFDDPGGTEFEPERPITGSERLTSSDKINFNTAHLFLQDNWFINDGLILYTGLVMHGENYLDKTFIEPRFAAEYTTQNNWILSMGLGQYHQMPDIDEIDKVFGNPDLKYIESKHAVLGVAKEFENGWHWKSDIYYKKLDNLVTGDEDKRYVNEGEGEAYGLEVLVRKELTNRFSGWLSLTAASAKRRHKMTGDRFKFDYDQPVNASLVGQYKLSERTKLGVKYWVHSGTPYTPVLGAQQIDDDPERYEPVYGEVNSERLPTFQRLDLRIDRDLKTTGRVKLTGYLELLNALNRKNVDGYDYNKDFSSREEEHQLPRIVSFGIKASF